MRAFLRALRIVSAITLFFFCWTCITASIANIGLDTTSNVIVRFFSGAPFAGGTQIDTHPMLLTKQIFLDELYYAASCNRWAIGVW